MSRSPEFHLERNPDASSMNWSGLLALLHRSFAYMDGRIDPPSSLHRLDPNSLAQKARFETLVVARHNNQIVGCMFCREEGAFLYVGKVAVEPEHQGKGLGRMLFDNAFQLAKQQGLMGLELECRVELTENHAAFEKMGFVKVGESAHDGFDRPTSISMRAVTEPL